MKVWRHGHMGAAERTCGLAVACWHRRATPQACLLLPAAVCFCLLRSLRRPLAGDAAALLPYRSSSVCIAHMEMDAPPLSMHRPDGLKKAYVRLTTDYDALDVANKIGII